jgi:hypothetical protein
MLKDILGYPCDGVVSRIHRLNTSRRKGVAALKALETRGLIAPEAVFTGASLIKLFDLTSEGRRFCQEQGLGPIPKPTEGGIAHRYLVHRVATKLKSQDWNVEKEAHIHEHLILDLLAAKEEQRLAVLVETGKSKSKENLEKTLAAGFQEIWVVSDAPAVHHAVEAYLRKHPAEARITLKTSSDL